MSVFRKISFFISIMLLSLSEILAMDNYNEIEEQSKINPSQIPLLQKLDETELERIESSYDLSVGNYSEDLKDYYSIASNVIFNALENLNGKKLGIILGDDHRLEGAKCFEILLTKLARSANIYHFLTEISPAKMEIITKKGAGLNRDSLFVQKLIQEANRLKMKVVPVDIDIEKNEEEDSLDSLIELFINNETRENNFIKEILNLEEPFIFITGSNHLSSLYYNKLLNEKYYLLFFNCSHSNLEKLSKSFDEIFQFIDDQDVSTTYNRMKKFFNETERSYTIPIKYNRQKSNLLRIMSSKFKSSPCGVSVEEIRGDGE